MTRYKLTKEQIEKKLKSLRKRLKQLETFQEKGCNHMTVEKIHFEHLGIEGKIFGLQRRLERGEYKK